MIGSRQIMPKVALGGGGLIGPIALVQQGIRALFVDSIVGLTASFVHKKTSSVGAFCDTGTFTADLYIDNVVVLAIYENETFVLSEDILEDGSIIHVKIKTLVQPLSGLAVAVH